MSVPPSSCAPLTRAEIEEFLYTHPDVSDVQVYGVPDEKYGEQVAAAIKKRPDSELSAQDVKEYSREHIARYKVPEYVDFVEDYPMTASGKIQKHKLRQAAVERYGLEAAGVDNRIVALRTTVRRPRSRGLYVASPNWLTA